MTRFKLQDWAGYIRGALTPEAMSEMADLLAQGDKEAVQLHLMASQIRDAGGYLASPGAPESVLRRAIALFPAKEKRSIFDIPLLSMNLVFDNLELAQPAGIRSMQPLARETVHESEDVQLRLSVEQDRATHLFAVVGQLTSDTVSIGNRPVLIYQKEHLVARTLSGERGEFQMEFSGRDPLRLLLLLENPERRIEVEIVQNRPKKTKRPPRSQNH